MNHTIPTPDEMCETKVIVLSSACGVHHREDCEGCKSARESNDCRLREKDATIERLTAALERAIEAIQAERDCTVECATMPPHDDLSTLDPLTRPAVEEYDAMLAYLRAALGKDASDVSSPGSSEGE